MAKTAYPSVDAYLAVQPEPARAALALVRQAIRRAIPSAEECISYQIPAYKINGRAVLYFAGWKKHFSRNWLAGFKGAVGVQDPKDSEET